MESLAHKCEEINLGKSEYPANGFSFRWEICLKVSWISKSLRKATKEQLISAVYLESFRKKFHRQSLVASDRIGKFFELSLPTSKVVLNYF